MKKYLFQPLILFFLIVFNSCKSDNPTEILDNNIEMSEDSIYVGGSFTISDAQNINNIALWDGKKWNSLGIGVKGKNVDVECMTFYNGELYVGGFIDSAGGKPVQNIAKWDGNNWSDVGGGIDGRVTSLVTYKGYLYAGGWFSHAGGLNADNIAKWNGVSWSAVGSGLSDEVYTLCIYKDKLYAGGWFTIDYYNRYFSANKIARWNGTEWDTVGTGITLEPSSGGGYVYDLVVYNDELYASGNFNRCGALNVSNIARWNGSVWQVVDHIALSNNTLSSAGFKNKIHLAGVSDSHSGSSIPYYAIWDGTNLNLSQFKLDGYPYCLYATESYLYCGGKFQTVNSIIVNGIFRWDGNIIENLGAGVKGYVSSFLIK